MVTETAILRNTRKTISGIADISRLAGKAAGGTILPRDFLAIRTALLHLADAKAAIAPAKNPLLCELNAKITLLPELSDHISRAIVDAPPAKTDEGGFIRAGFDAKLDECRAAETGGHEWLLKLESAERAETKIKELKIAYNRVAGYYFEIPTKLAAHVPYRFSRLGSTINCDRYKTDELKQIETKILGAHDNAIAIETRILADLRHAVIAEVSNLNETAHAIAVLDVVQSFATAAMQNNFVRPKINTNGKISLKNARHPAVEKSVGTNNFIANDCELENSTMLITGPNMAGKSTFMRMVAAVVLMTHVGSFVPADSADVALTDRIFTRIGASDSLFTGESTFMVEMNECCLILNNATDKSLILLDEVGRGTGTRDGRALAGAIVEYAAAKIGANTMFATHFHELTALASANPKIKNYKAQTEFVDNEIIFLHKIEPGIEQNSFGIDVAKMAGLPREIIDNARKIYNRDRARDN
jgi:DNA mismatch repair protein MutS